MRSRILSLLTLVATASLFCDLTLCPVSWRGDGFCDVTCMTTACGFDSAGGGSDCDALCAAKGCGVRTDSDPPCRAECNIPECKWDDTACGVCASGCSSDLLTNTVCDSQCDSQQCNFDGGYCGSCAKGCFDFMLGNTVCDSACLNAVCKNDNGDCESTLCASGCYPYLVNNRHCDEACHNAACGWDGRDCDCSPGCTAELLANGMCDSLCDTVDCGFDAGMCGLCASGCFKVMIGNKACESQCNTKECGYDGLDCGCAPMCDFSDLGNCKAECLVADCNFDAYPGFPSCSDPKLQKAAFLFSLIARNFSTPYDFSVLCTAASTCSASNWLTAQTVCSSRCNVLGCAHSQGNCFTASPCVPLSHCNTCELISGGCVNCQTGYLHFYNSCIDACPIGFALHPLVPALCYPTVDTSSADSPALIYVQSSTNLLGTGSYSNPLDTLSAALDAVSKRYTIVYLLAGAHKLSKCQFAPYVVAMGQSIPQSSIVYSGNLTIAGFDCSLDTNSPKSPACANTRPQLVFENLNPVSVFIRGIVTFRGVEFWGGSTLVAGCIADLCTFCPRVIATASGTFVDDRGADILSGFFAPSAACTPFLTQRFITLDVNSSLHVTNVTFSNFKQGFRTLIYFTEGNVTISHSNFTNVTVGMALKPTYSTTVQIFFDSVIVQENPTGKSFVNATLVLDAVGVLLLNNGYEYNVNLSYGGFLSVQGLRVISLNNLWFSYCLCPRSGLITAGNFLTLSIQNSVFDTIYAGMFLIRLSPSFPLNNPVEGALTHITLRENFFIRCAVALPGSTTSGMAISVYMPTTYFNIVLEGLTFKDTFTQNTLMYFFKSTTPSSTEMNGGFVLSRVAGQLITTLIPRRTMQAARISISGSVVASSAVSSGLLNLGTLANINLTSFTVTDSGDAKGIDSINTKAIAYFVIADPVYLIKLATGLVYTPCMNPVLLRNIANLIASHVWISDSECRSAGTGGLATSGTYTGDFRLTNATFHRLSGQSSTMGICLHVQSQNAIYLTDVTAMSTSATKTGCICLSSPQAISISRLSITSSKSEVGQLQLLSVQNFTLSQCAFTYITSGKEAGVTVVPIAGASAAFARVEKCRFEGNKGLMGTGMYFSGDVTAVATVTLQIEDSDFKDNIGTSRGSGLLVDSSNALGPNSFIRNTRMRNNTVNEAVLYFAYQRGTLELSQLLCSGSKLDETLSSLTSVGCIFGEFKSTEDFAPEIRISNSVFENNLGVSMISITSATGQARLTSFNNTFEGNAGRAVFLDKAKLSDSNSRVLRNRRVGIFVTGSSSCEVTNSSFAHNLGKLSGALYLGGESACQLSACLFLNNSADSGSGAIFVEQSSEITLNSCVFRNNLAWERGAALSLFGSKANSSVRDTLFEGNENGEGGTILVLSSALRLLNVTIRGNKGRFAPGLLAYFSGVTVEQSTFQDQVAESGSFLYLSVDSNVTVSFCRFVNGLADLEGGAIYLQSAELTVEFSTFLNTSAQRGALVFSTSASILRIRNSASDVSIARFVQGGVIYSSEGTAMLDNFTLSTFRNNAIVSVSQKRLSLLRVSLLNGSGRQGAGVYCSECQHFEVEHSVFENLTAQEGSALFVDVQQIAPSPYIFRYCTFFNNSAAETGAIRLNDVSAEFHSCTFAHNSALAGNGGALHLQCPDFGCSVYVTSCTFHHNTAAQQGGSISWEHAKPVLASNSFSEGEALYGHDIASFAIALSVQAVTGNATLESVEVDAEAVPIEAVLHSAGSGQLIDSTVSVALLDHYGQIVRTENEDTASLWAPAAHENAFGNISVTAVNGTFTFRNFGVSARPGSVSKIYIHAGSVGANGHVSTNETITDRIALKVEMRHCVMGESQVGIDCIVCPEGKFSFDPESNCQECLSEAICYGNFTMVPKKGYWRANIYSPRFYECPNPEACIGSPEPPELISLRGECRDGYFGNLCNGCLSGYSRQNQEECLPCPSLIVNAIRMSGIGIGVFVALIVIVRTAISSAKKQRSYYSIFIKIMLNYLQLVMLTAAFQMRWPSYMKELFKVQQSAGNVTEQIFAVDCFFSTGEQDAQAVAVRMKLIGIALAPALMVGLAVLIWLPVTLIRRRMAYLKNELVTTVVVCFFLIHPSIVKFMFSFMYCRELEVGEFWLNDYLNIRCWDFIHYRYVFIVTLPSIVAWGIGVPMLCLLLLFRNKNRLSLLELKLRLGFVYNGYEHTKYYWEFVILYRKILIITVAVFLTNVSTSIQALTVMMLLIGAFSLQLKHKPFALSEMNDLELRGILVSAVTIYCGLYYMTNDLDAVSQIIMFTIVVTINAYFLVLWCVRVFSAGFQVIKRRCPCLFKCFGTTHYKVQPGGGLVPVKVGSSVSRSQHDSALVDGESIDLSRFYDSESINESNLRRRPRLVSEPKLMAPDNTPGSGSIPRSPM